MSTFIDVVVSKLNSRQLTSSFVILVGFVAASQYFDKLSDKEFGWVVLAFSIIAVLAGFSGVFVDLIKYDAKQAEAEDTLYDDEELSDRIADISKKIDNLTHVSINVESNSIDARQAVIEAIESAAATAVSKAQKAARNIEDSRMRSLASSQLSKGRMRLTAEIRKVGKRATTNLIIGSLISIVGIFVIAATAFTLDISQNDWLRDILKVAPRVSLGILVEFFAIFFLKLYRSSFEEMRYYHNEITNIDFRSSALLAAIGFGGEESVRSVVEKMADTERNFILDKDKSTIELRKTELDAEGERKYFSLLSGLVDKMAKSK